MRRKLAIGALGFMVILGAAVLSWAQDGPPQGPGPGQAQHQFGGDGPHHWGEGSRPGERGEFGMRKEGRMGWQHGGGFGAERMLRMVENPRVRQILGLSDDQVARLRTIGVDAEKAAIQSHADMELRGIELRELLRADNPDHDAIMQKLDEINALRGKIAKQRVEALLSARGVLTPEQVKKVRTFMESGGFGHGPERGTKMQWRGNPNRRPQGPGGPAQPAPTPPAQ